MTHKHDMKDLEQTTTIYDTIYDTWCCFDRDCNYHEFRYKYPVPPIIKIPEEVLNDPEKIEEIKQDLKIWDWIDKNVKVSEFGTERKCLEDNLESNPISERMTELVSKAMKELYEQGFDPNTMKIEAVNDPIEPFTIRFIAVPRKTY